MRSAPRIAPSNAGNTRPIVLIGFQSMGNLGLGYLAATLREAGYDVRVLDIELPQETLVAAVLGANPMLVGFSVIFQFYIRRYADLMAALRAAGVAAHFTMGGHYPTLSPDETLKAAPALDSIMRYEGEVTLLEMVRALAAGDDWRGLHGVVWKQDGQTGANPPRALIHDLDSLPYPERDFEPMRVLGRAIMPIPASRGCARTCSFCSIHTFYRSAPGKVVRIRKAAEVVREMKMLHEQEGVTVFLFQDDDFPLFGKKWRAWAGEFVDELHGAGLPGRAVWKINCRADVVDAELMARMRNAGLYLVYMGLESGTEEGLKTLNKEISVAEPRGGSPAQVSRHPLRVRLHAARSVQHLRLGARQPRLPARDRPRRQRLGNLLQDASLRRKADQGRSSSRRAAEGRCLHTGQRLPRCASGRLLLVIGRDRRCNWLDPRPRGADAPTQLGLDRGGGDPPALPQPAGPGGLRD